MAINQDDAFAKVPVNSDKSYKRRHMEAPGGPGVWPAQIKAGIVDAWFCPREVDRLYEPHHQGTEYESADPEDGDGADDASSGALQ